MVHKNVNFFLPKTDKKFRTQYLQAKNIMDYGMNIDHTISA